MRKLLIGLLAIGLVFFFVGPSFATDVSMSGAYRVRGFYFANGASALKYAAGGNAPEQYYDQRFRLGMKFAVAEGIGLEARGDILEKKWGEADPAAEFDFDKAYGWFQTGIGTFTLGQNSDNTWGTAFADQELFTDYIQWTNTFGPVFGLFRVVKGTEADKGATNADLDTDYYKAAVIYGWEGGQAGLLGVYVRDAANRNIAAPGDYMSEWWVWAPYMKATFGPVYVEAELLWKTGTEKDYETAGVQDVDFDGMSYYVQAKMNLGPANVGFMYAYVSGDDPTTNDNEAGYTGSDWNPSVVLFNDQGTGNCAGATFGVVGGNTVGSKVYQIFAGVSPIEKLSLNFALSQFYVDEKNDGAVVHGDDDLGTTADIMASYKIFDSVTYYVQFGYLWAGDYWKGAAGSGTETEDTYTIVNKIEWSF